MDPSAQYRANAACAALFLQEDQGDKLNALLDVRFAAKNISGGDCCL